VFAAFCQWSCTEGSGTPTMQEEEEEEEEEEDMYFNV